MSTLALWAHSDVKPASRSGSNLTHGALSAGDGWDEVLAALQLWASDPTVLEDDDVDAPSVLTIDLAMDVARQLRAVPTPAPTRVMPNREGGVLLEWVAGSLRGVWEIDDQHRLEVSVFDSGRRVSRQMIDISGPRR